MSAWPPPDVSTTCTPGEAFWELGGDVIHDQDGKTATTGSASWPVGLSSAGPATTLPFVAAVVLSFVWLSTLSARM
ncbi:hypothetical protein [Actinopolymorpha sp. B9G3]|uniref:hypothetical protein n=1 Tax=Actinopolymorpha sp. B9G3 TaxID=3158970 RepID=UPI0032D908AB